MKDRLVIEEERRGYRFYIAWYFPESGDLGAQLGDAHPHKGADEHDIASRAAWGAAPALEGAGYFWETKAQATTALRAANAALRAANATVKTAQSSVPLPEWAKQALAAGWKMPRGWKPKTGERP